MTYYPEFNTPIKFALILVLCFLYFFCFKNQVLGQTYFSKFDFETGQISSYGIQLNKLNNLYLLSSPGICDYKNSFSSCAELTTFDDTGNTIWAKNFPWLKINKFSTIVTENEILVLGTTHPDYVSFSLVKLSHEGDSLEVKNIPFDGYLRFNNRNFFKYGDQYIISGQTQYAQDSMFYAGLIWLNADFTVDTIMHFPGNSGSFERGFEDEDGNCHIFMIYYDRPAKDQYYGYKKFDRYKKELHSWFDKTDDYYDMDGIMLDDGTKYFVRSTGFHEEIYKLDQTDSLLWVSRISRVTDRFNTSIFQICNNKDILITGYKTKNIFNDLRTLGNIVRISPDGVVKWDRGYGSLNDEEGFRILNYLRSIEENEGGDLIMGGSIEGGIGIPLYQYIVAEADLWVLKTDSLGCLNDDKCNDDNFIRYFPAELNFDQLTMRHKEWFTSTTGNTGKEEHWIHTFGKDTVRYDIEFGWQNFRKLKSTNTIDGTVINNITLVRMDEYGRVFGLENNSCTLCNSFLLYDFTLTEGDTFSLPYQFGDVIVSQVDTVFLLNGYPRKRMVLTHINEEMQTTYGNLIWIEGIGALNGILYYEDWQNHTRTHTTCYYDRDILKYTHPFSADCILSSTVDKSQNPPIIVFPNPTNHLVYYFPEQTLTLQKIEILDMTGRLRLSQKHDTGEVDVSSLTAGVYFLNFYTKKNEIITKKFIKI